MWIDLLIEQDNKLEPTLKSKFIGEANVISDLYNQYLVKLKVKIVGVKKIAITLTDRPNISLFALPIKVVGPISTIDKTYNFDFLAKLDDKELKEEILEVIQSTIREAATKFQWDIEPFENVYQRVKGTGLINEYIEGGLVSSKNKQYKAGVQVAMSPDGASIYIAFFDKNENFIKRINFIKVHPNKMFIIPLIGKGRWISNDDFVISNKTKEIHFKASLESGKAELFYTPVNNTEDKLTNSLLIASTTTNKEQITSLIQDRIQGIY